MGFWERFLGKETRKQHSASTIDPQAPIETMPQTEPLPVETAKSVADEIDPQIIAAIIAGIEAATDDAELMAAVMAAAVHAHNNSVKALRIKRTSDAWRLTGRQKLMYNRQQ